MLNKSLESVKRLPTHLMYTAISRLYKQIKVEEKKLRAEGFSDEAVAKYHLALRNGIINNQFEMNKYLSVRHVGEKAYPFFDLPEPPWGLEPDDRWDDIIIGADKLKEVQGRDDTKVVLLTYPHMSLIETVLEPTAFYYAGLGNIITAARSNMGLIPFVGKGALVGGFYSGIYESLNKEMFGPTNTGIAAYIREVLITNSNIEQKVTFKDEISGEELKGSVFNYPHFYMSDGRFNQDHQSMFTGVSNAQKRFATKIIQRLLEVQSEDLSQDIIVYSILNNISRPPEFKSIGRTSALKKFPLFYLISDALGISSQMSKAQKVKLPPELRARVNFTINDGISLRDIVSQYDGEKSKQIKTVVKLLENGLQNYRIHPEHLVAKALVDYTSLIETSGNINEKALVNIVHEMAEEYALKGKNVFLDSPAEDVAKALKYFEHAGLNPSDIQRHANLITHIK